MNCGCACSTGGFCGGCGHAGCSGGINVRARPRSTGGFPTKDDRGYVPRCRRCGEMFHSGQDRAEVMIRGHNAIIHAACLAEGEVSA